MSNTGEFSNTVKESNLIIKQQDGNEKMLTCTILDFQDKIIINLSLDGETDISYDIQIPQQNEFKRPYQIDDLNNEVDNELDNDDISSTSTIVPIVLIGAGNNIKTQVLASQIGKVMSEESNKNIILNISGRIFGNKDDEFHPNDSTVVKQCIHIVTDTYIA